MHHNISLKAREEKGWRRSTGDDDAVVLRNCLVSAQRESVRSSDGNVCAMLAWAVRMFFFSGDLDDVTRLEDRMRRPVLGYPRQLFLLDKLYDILRSVAQLRPHELRRLTASQYAESERGSAPRSVPV